MSSRLIVEAIASEETLLASATAEDLSYVEQFGSAKRRCEVLAWRAMVRRELGADVAISHNDYGAPQVDVPDTYISISHSREMVALLVSDSPCAVDVEHTSRNFRNVAAKYLSSEEQLLASRYDLFAEMWCAKEALYKYHQRGGLDYVTQITIHSYDADGETFEASICGGERVVVRLKREDNHSIALIY